MKRPIGWSRDGGTRWWMAVGLWVMGCALALVHAATAPLTQPRIAEIQVTRKLIAVTVEYPAGLKKITLEGRSRIGQGSWVPRAVERVGSEAGVVTFKLDAAPELELLRVRADDNEPLPALFYRGTNQFAGPVVGGGSAAPPNGMVPVANDAARNLESGGAGGAKDARSVVESDIWKVAGNTVYFFNQYRGLQVVDVSAPDAPVLRGTLPMAAAGEEMYLLDDGHVVLLARDTCNYSADGNQSQLIVVRVNAGIPEIAAAVPVAGTITESRLVGSALYLAAQTYRKTVATPAGGREPQEQWEWGTTVSSYDLANPLAPVAKSSIWVPGWGNAVTATDRFLFLSAVDSSDFRRSTVRLIDISAPDGSMSTSAVLKPAGTVADKFKIHLDGDILSVISERFDQALATKEQPSGSWITTVETFSVAVPTAPERLGLLELGRGERLFATRFDGSRVYVVTFLRIDPLWIVDLSDPRQPRILGELEIPGWSTYIQPLGDRLVTVGIDDTNGWRVAVQLFDVKDPAKPALLSKVPLGDNHSWSEANYNEKAFTVLPEAGLILLPYGGYSVDGYAQRVQLIDLGEKSLTARGTIEHRFQPRRSTLHRDRILSLSGQELLSVDATDRDKPKVSATLELAWAADRVFAVGQHLVQIANEWSGESKVSVRVVAAGNPNALLAQQVLEQRGLLGVTVNGQRLYLLQGTSTEYVWPVAAEGSVVPKGPSGTNAASLTLTVLDLSQLPAIKVVGKTTATMKEEAYWGDFNPLWLKSGLLVWSGGVQSWGPWLFMDAKPGVRFGGAAISDIAIAPGRFWWPSGGGGQLVAFQVKAEGDPQFVSHTRIENSGHWWSFSSAFAGGDKVFLSHQSYEFVPGVLPAGEVTPVPGDTADGSKPDEIREEAPVGMWMHRHFLDVVDFEDPAHPTVRKPVNLPGALQGVAHEGELLFTLGQHWDAVKLTTDWSEWLDALAYDGVSAHLVDSFQLPAVWPRPLLVSEGRIYLGRPPTEKVAAGSVEIWQVSPVGKFERISSILEGVISEELAVFDSILAVRQGMGIQLVDVTNPKAVTVVGKAQQEGCFGMSLFNASYSAETGLWVPLSAYGIFHVPLLPR